MTLTELAALIMREHTAVLGASRTLLDHARCAGEHLIAAKGQVNAQLGHGHWLPWLAANCDLKPRMAQVYMEIAREWPRLEEYRNAYPNTHLGIDKARWVLANPGEAHPDDKEDAGDPSLPLAPGGYDSADDVDDAPVLAVGVSRDHQTQVLHLAFTVEQLKRFRANVALLAAAWGITGTSEADVVDAVLAYAAAMIQPEQQETVAREHHLPH